MQQHGTTPPEDTIQSQEGTVLQDDTEEEFIMRINEAFKCGEEISRRLAHAMLVGPPGSGKSSLMHRLLRRKRRKSATSTDVAESIVTIEVRLDEKQSTFHAAVVIDGEWMEFEFSDSLLSHMSLKQETPFASQPSQVLSQPSEDTSQPIEVSSQPSSEVCQESSKPPASQVPSQPKEELTTEASTTSLLTATKEANQLPPAHNEPDTGSPKKIYLTKSMISYLRKKHGSYKQFKKFLERGFSLYLRDTGGQVEFQEMLPLLIFGPSIFLFLFRLDLPFKMKFEVKYRVEDGAYNDYISSITIEEALLQCLTTVDVIKRTDKASIETRDPYVFIVGTHKDELEKKLNHSVEEEICKLNLNLDALLKEHGFNNLVSYAGNDPEHVMYTVDNTSEDETDFDLIRSRINAVITSRKEFIVHYPINYLLFCLDLQNVKDNVIFLEDFKERARAFGIEGSDEVSKLLHFLCNRIGIIQHFDKEGVKHIVINQPQFLYKKVSNLIIETFKGKTLSADERVELEKGILSFKAAESIVGSESKITTVELLNLLVHLRIIARFKGGKYFIPCVINHLPEASDEEIPGESTVAPLYIRFGCHYCPKGLFGVLVTYLMSLEEETSSSTLNLELKEDKVSKDQVSFEVESGEDTLDLLSLKVVACSFLEVTIFPEERDPSLITDMCITIRNLIETCLIKSFQDLHYNEEMVKYEICLKCESCSNYHKVLSMNKLRCKRKKIPLPPKGKYWFSECQCKCIDQVMHLQLLYT